MTDVGNRLYENTLRGVEALLEVGQGLISDQAQLRGRLRLSLPATFFPWWQLLSDFQVHYPDIEVHVISTERRLDLVEDRVDVALRVGAVVHDNMVARRVFSFRHVLVASPQYLARYGHPSHPDELARFPCAAWSTRVDDRPVWHPGNARVLPRAILTVNDYRHLLHSALAGDVITELPPFLAQEPVRQGRLVLLLDEWPFPDSPVSLVYPAHRHPSSLVRSYLAFCRDNIAQVTGACIL